MSDRPTVRRAPKRVRSAEAADPAALREAAEHITDAKARLAPGTRVVCAAELDLSDTLLPVEALDVLPEMLNRLADGKPPHVLVLADSDTLTTEEAAQLLGVSRPHLIQLRASEHIPHRRTRRDSPRAHRRIDRRAILELRARRERAMRRADELTRLSEQLAD